MKRIFTFLLAVVIAVSSFAFCTPIVNASEAKASIEETSPNSIVAEDTIRLYVDGNGFVSGTEIDIVIFTTLSSEIRDIEFEGNGFSLIKNFENTDGNIHFSVINDITVEAPSLNVEVELEDGKILTANLYGFVCDGRIYIDPHAYFFAERAYLYYTGNTSAMCDPTVNDSIIADDVATQISGEEPAEVTSSTDTPDTTVSGKFLWTDIVGNTHPLRFIKIKVYKNALILTKCIYEGYTDENGEFTFSFSSDLLNGSQKIAFKVYAQGTDITVKDAYSFTYNYRIDPDNDGMMNLDSITVGENNLANYTFAVNDMTDESDMYFCRALEIAQSAIYASTYYEDMKGSDVSDVDVIYPHNEDSDSTFYRRSEERIYVLEAGTTLPSYADCDAITHEYGHHVSYCEGIIESPGGAHGISADMAEHYKDHYEGTTVDCSNKCGLKCGSSEHVEFVEGECKVQGCRLAWAEGYATFFGELAQQYFNENYVDSEEESIPEFADANYDSYNFLSSSPINMENGLTFRNDSCELVVIRVLYDIFDGDDEEDFDDLEINHQELWDCIVESDAKTMFEFIEYFNNQASVADKNGLGEVLHAHHLATSAPTIPNINAENPTVEFIWNEPNTEGFYNARKFQVNFYNRSYDLIGSTPRQTVTFDSSNEGSIEISDVLWQSVLNYGGLFYATVTVFECDGNLNNSDEGHFITHYESAYSSHSVSDITSLLVYNSSVMGSIQLGGYIWYKFTAPLAEQYVFQSLGTTDTYGELFSALAVGTTTNNRLTYDNDSGTDNNFKITYNLSKGQTVYIRVRGDGWTETGSYTLTISSTNHTHVYTDHYEKSSSSHHNAYCVCGSSTSKAHEYLITPKGKTCKWCGYLAINIPVTPITGTTPGVNGNICTVDRKEDE